MSLGICTDFGLQVMKALEFDPPLINTVHVHTLTHALSHDLWTSLWIQFPAHSRRKVYRVYDQSRFIVSKIITCAQFQLLLVLDDKRSWQSSEDSPVPPSFFTSTFDTLSLIILGDKWWDLSTEFLSHIQKWREDSVMMPASTQQAKIYALAATGMQPPKKKKMKTCGAHHRMWDRS